MDIIFCSTSIFIKEDTSEIFHRARESESIGIWASILPDQRPGQHKLLRGEEPHPTFHRETLGCVATTRTRRCSEGHTYCTPFSTKYPRLVLPTNTSTVSHHHSHPLASRAQATMQILFTRTVEQRVRNQYIQKKCTTIAVKDLMKSLQMKRNKITLNGCMKLFDQASYNVKQTRKSPNLTCGKSATNERVL